MHGFVVGADDGEVRDRAERLTAAGFPPDDGWPSGSPAQVAERLAEYADAGVERVMLQHLLHRDTDALELLAAEVVPALVVTAFAGARLDRAGDGRRRDAAWVAAQRADPAARAVVAGSGGVRLAGDRLAIVPLAEAPAAAEPLLLGLDEHGPLFAVDEDVPPPGPEAPPLLASIRDPRLRARARAGGRRGVAAGRAPRRRRGPLPG